MTKIVISKFHPTPQDLVRFDDVVNEYVKNILELPHLKDRDVAKIHTSFMTLCCSLLSRGKPSRNRMK